MLNITHEKGFLILTKGHYLFVVRNNEVQHVPSETAAVGEYLLFQELDGLQRVEIQSI